MKIWAVTSYGTACGIAAYAESLQDALQQVAPSIHLLPDASWLDPESLLDALEQTTPETFPDVVWLNHHKGLHSRWHEGKIAQVQDQGIKVVATVHDTQGEAPPDAVVAALYQTADACVVHEPCVGLERATYLRQGVPAYSPPNAPPYALDRPWLGTVGWNFPWKGFDQLAQVTGACGWGLLILSNDATLADMQRWQEKNPHCSAISGYLSTGRIVSELARCDATAYCYRCANTGTSGAIRLGMAARKPVIAFRECRQFRELRLLDTALAIHWCGGFEDLPWMLAQVPIQRCDPGIVALAHLDSWTNQARVYAELFNRVVAS